jgi:hypothetical protein
VEEIDKELYSIDRVKGDLDLTVENKTIEEVAEAVVQVKREIQTWGEQAPKDIQVFIPGIESFIEEQIRKGVDVDDLMDTLKSPEFKAAVEKLKPLVELLENNPEQLQAALAEAKKITPDQISVNADGLTVIDIKGSKEIPIKTEVLHAMGILNQAVETVMQSESGQMVQLLAAALGGLPRLVASTAIDEIVGDELAELQKNAAIAIGAWGTGRSSAEFSEDVTDEQIYKDRNFFQTVEGGASLSMTLGNILLIGKAVDGKKDGDSSSGPEGNVVSVNKQNSTIKNSPDYEALNNSAPNTRYELDNGTTFKTNSGGRVEEVTFTPVDQKAPRDSRQTAVGNEGLPNDVGGHIQACSMGGTCDRYNLFPQDKNFNNSGYKKFENEIRNALKNGDDVGPVTVKFQRKDPNSARPDALRVEYTINGTRFRKEFKNQKGG